MKVEVRGYWSGESRICKGPLGQRKQRYPFTGGQRTTVRVMELTKEEASRLVHCRLCGRATINPQYHTPSHLPSAPERRDPHCEVCAEYTNSDGELVGWYGGPYKVVA